MMRFLRPFTLCLAVLLALPGAAGAQVFSGVAEDDIRFGGSNPDLQAIIQLQYQMQMLQRMIERERAVNRMVEAALAIGVTDPDIPAPSYTVCRQIPANIVCAQAHAGIYENYSVDRIVPLVPIDPIAKAVPPIPLNDASLPLDIAEMQPSETLYWMDITCMGLKCSAVVSPEPANANARYRITIGDTLPDGATVDGISANGVTLKHGKQEIRLDPAPAA